MSTKVKPIIQFLTALSLVLAALPLQMVQAARAESHEPEDLLQFVSGGHALGFGTGGMYAATGSHALHVDFLKADAVKPQAGSSASPDGKAAPLGRVAYPDLWDGITLTYTAGAGSIYTTTYALEPGADPSDIRLLYNAPLSVNEDGTLSIAFDTGVMTESAPVAWQEIGGERVPVDAAFQVNGREVGFLIGDFNSRYSLTIDPGLTWNTFLGSAGSDTAYGVAVDGSGNVYVTGASDNFWASPVQAYGGGTTDAYAVKLSSTGSLTWNTYLGGSGSDEGRAIAVDGSGNVYIAGSSASSWGSPIRSHSGGNDAFAAKLNSSGSLVWNTFLGSANADTGFGIAVDGSGNVYATGDSDGTWGAPARAYTAGIDTFAVKLTSAGALTWNTFLGGSGADSGRGITVDGSGYVFVAGYSTSAWSCASSCTGIVYEAGYDAFAAKLNSTGTLVENAFLGGDGADYGYGIAVDGTHHVYVTGYSNITWGSPNRAFTGGWDAFVTKLGDDLIGSYWNTFLGGEGFDYGYGIAVDGSENVYVTGYSGASWESPVHVHTGGYDAFAAKLTSGGVLTWNTFQGNNDSDEAFGIAVDGSGSVYAAGQSISSWGSPVRAHSGGASDAFAAKFDSAGNLTWNSFLGGSGEDDAKGIAVDGSGNIYVMGYGNANWGSPVRAYSGGYDVFAAKLGPSGLLTWNTFLGASGLDRGYGTALDGDGNVYVTGSSSTTWGSPVRAYSGISDAFVARLNPDTGALVWNTFLGGSGDAEGYGIAADSGNIYVTGYSSTTWGSPVNPYSSQNDAFAAKLTSAGALTWNTFLGASGDDRGRSIAVDGSGNIYISGSSNSTWGSPQRAYTGLMDAFVAKLNSAGSLTWNTYLGGSGNDQGFGIAADGGGNVYVMGGSDASWGSPLRAFSGTSDAFAAKLGSSTGSLTWNTFLGGSTDDGGFAITVDGSGNIYVAGSSGATWGSPVRSFGGNFDGFAAKLDSSGTIGWNAFLGGIANDSSTGIAVDGSGNVFVTGGSSRVWGTPVQAYAGGFDIFVAMVGPNPPSAFGKTTPANSGYATTSPTLSWTASSGATGYEYCYDTSNNNVCNSSWVSAGAATFAVLSGLGNNDTYYWQARAVNGDGSTEADGGTWWSFTARNQTFADVPIDHSLWQYIEAFYTAGITGGCGFDPLIFCPTNNVTRAAMAVFLLRAKYGAGYAPPPATHTFSDLPVAGKEWQEAWVDQFYLEGITSGCGTSPLRYCPENPVTRAAMAVFILRALEGPSYTPPAASHFFSDMPVAGKEWMEPWVDEVYRRGITTGCGTGPLIFCPETAVKRQAMAAFIVRAFNLPLP